MPVPLLRRAIRRRHSAVDEGRGGRVVARHIHPLVIPSAALQLSIGSTHMRVYKSVETALQTERDLGY